MWCFSSPFTIIKPSLRIQWICFSISRLNRLLNFLWALLGKGFLSCKEEFKDDFALTKKTFVRNNGSNLHKNFPRIATFSCPEKEITRKFRGRKQLSNLSNFQVESLKYLEIIEIFTVSLLFVFSECVDYKYR